MNDVYKLVGGVVPVGGDMSPAMRTAITRP
jgi:hypothetical protein